MTNHSFRDHLSRLETGLTQAGIDAYIVPMVDEFQGEYIPEYAARLPYVTGFTGSAGMGVFWAKPLGAKRHTLFVDGRYVLQAPNEVDTAAIEVLNSGEVPFTDWLKTHADAAEALRIGLDPWLVTMAQWKRWTQTLTRTNAALIAVAGNQVDAIWQDQPAPPAGEVMLHPEELAGVRYEEKRTPLLEMLGAAGADALLLTQPDAINWLLNIRGNDIPFNPLLLSYFLLKQDGRAVLYTYPHTLTEEVQNYLDAQGVTLGELKQLFAGALDLPRGATVMVDATSTPYGVAQLAEQKGLVLSEVEDPTQLPKACKNAAELAAVRDAHRRDGLALSRFLNWFDFQVERKKTFDELEVVAKLEEYRRKDVTYRGPSFATIAGSGPNGAIVHYRADVQSNRRAKIGELFLLDSGGQYPGGTTDVTRTLTLGPATTVMKEHYTRVLKGHIALASVQFPRGTAGIQLDILARQHLWAAGLDFDHGTGHGVGAYLCVHEGPQRISKRGSMVPLEPGMILSNEPGYYATGRYGIRIENLVVVVEAKDRMLAFETLTLAPMDTRLIEVSMLTADERNWLNHYHQRVYNTHADAMTANEKAWLAHATRAI